MNIHKLKGYTVGEGDDMKKWITRQNEKIRKLESIKNNHTIWGKYSVPQKYRIYKRLWDLRHPMNRRLTSIKQRCENPNDTMYYLYGAKGIKCLLTLKNLHYLWKRDNAQNMDNPSVDRIDNKGNYTLKNCRFLEGIDNTKRTRRNIGVQDNTAELQTVLRAWHDVFGTTQLTHAKCRLDVAEEKATKFDNVKDSMPSEEQITEILIEFDKVRVPDINFDQQLRNYDIVNAVHTIRKLMEKKFDAA